MTSPENISKNAESLKNDPVQKKLDHIIWLLADEDKHDGQNDMPTMIFPIPHEVVITSKGRIKKINSIGIMYLKKDNLLVLNKSNDTKLVAGSEITPIEKEDWMRLVIKWIEFNKKPSKKEYSEEIELSPEKSLDFLNKIEQRILNEKGRCIQEEIKKQKAVIEKYGSVNFDEDKLIEEAYS